MLVKWGVLDVASQENLYVASHKKSGDGAITQGIEWMQLYEWRVTYTYFQWLQTAANKT